LGNLRVRGRHEAVSVYELLAENADALSPARRQHLELYMQGWVFYQKRAWDRASAALESALQLEPTDCATQMLLQRCCEFRVKPPPENWDGAIDVSLP
jgi:adenylate cyclase